MGDFQCQSPSEYRSTNFGACESCRNDVFSDTSIGAKLCTLCKGKGQHKITRNNAWVNHNEVCSRCFGTGLEMKCNAYSTHVGVEKRNPANSPQKSSSRKNPPMAWAEGFRCADKMQLQGHTQYDGKQERKVKVLVVKCEDFVQYVTDPAFKQRRRLVSPATAAKLAK